MLSPNKQAGQNRNRWLIWVLPVFTLAVCTLISWLLVTQLAPAKSDYDNELPTVNHDITHMQDRLTGLDNIASRQIETIAEMKDSTLQSIDNANHRLELLAGQIQETSAQTSGLQSDLGTLNDRTDLLESSADQLNSADQQINSAVTAADAKAASALTKIDTLNTSVTKLNTAVQDFSAGLQIKPEISASSTTAGTGYVTLTIESDIAQIVAFKLEFRPPADSDVLPTGATMDQLLHTLYTTPPLVVHQATSSGKLVRGDYQLFWDDDEYHVGLIIFITEGAEIKAGSQTKKVYFKYTDDDESYDVLITPIVVTGETTDGSEPDTW
jgi:prefoldin subunit 5